MKLSIITITYNNADGLRKTLDSVTAQTFRNFEHIIVDGGSTDGSVEIIEAYEASSKSSPKGKEFYNIESNHSSESIDRNFHYPVRWISEQDKGVYDAQNKGIEIVLGKRVINDDHTSLPHSLLASLPHSLNRSYLYFLNAGDTFCANDVLEKIFQPSSLLASSSNSITDPLPHIIYGNEVIVDGAGMPVGIARGVDNPSFVDLYNSCMKHQASFIHTELFEKYGMYDADMRICSDFDWFFRVIAFHDEVSLQYKDIDIAYFENTGLSYHNPELCAKERQQILDRYMSKRMQRDYALWSKYPRLSRAGENMIVKLLLRIANRLLK